MKLKELTMSGVMLFGVVEPSVAHVWACTEKDAPDACMQKHMLPL